MAVIKGNNTRVVVVMVTRVVVVMVTRHPYMVIPTYRV